MFFVDDFSFFSSSTHQGFIASICLVHFYHIIWTFYKCHKCVTSNKLFSLNSHILYLLRHNYRKLDDESYKWTQISFDMLILIEKSRSIFTHVNVSVGCHNNGEFVLYVVSFSELWFFNKVLRCHVHTSPISTLQKLI